MRRRVRSPGMDENLEKIRSRREWVGVVALTAIGLGLRLWPIGRLGLNHFDEGIYALAAQWSLLPRGLAGLDPSLIPYAPPGYPILAGLAYWLLGRSDGAMIAVSQLAGTATIPMVAWLGRRTFGPGAGFAAAAFCAFSGPHIAFSRMALTDASFLLMWLLAIGAGMRFLERPGAVRAVVMGLAVGLAQEFKYNGWLTGAIVIGSALIGILTRSEERNLHSIARTFGWGILATGVAWLVVWPWFTFVEGHGGYPALLKHQRSYLGKIGDWDDHLLSQGAQAIGLSGGWAFLILAIALVSLVPVLLAEERWALGAMALPLGRCRIIAIACGVVASGFVVPPFLGILALPWFLGFANKRTVDLFGPTPRAVRVVGLWWLALGIMTPFYHPYARLLLPFHAAHWLMLGWLFGSGLPAILGRLLKLDESAPWPREALSVQVMMRVTIFLGFTLVFSWMILGRVSIRPTSGLLYPSDSLYRATVQVAQILPDSVKGLRLLVRPPVTYYLAGRVALYPMADSKALDKPGDPSVWALVDSAILVSEPGPNSVERFANNWEIVETIPTNPNLPTVLDLDPKAALATKGDWTYPLWLLRPRTSKAMR